MGQLSSFACVVWQLGVGSGVNQVSSRACDLRFRLVPDQPRAVLDECICAAETQEPFAIDDMLTGTSKTRDTRPVSLQLGLM